MIVKSVNELSSSELENLIEEINDNDNFTNIAVDILEDLSLSYQTELETLNEDLYDNYSISIEDYFSNSDEIYGIEMIGVHEQPDIYYVEEQINDDTYRLECEVSLAETCDFIFEIDTEKTFYDKNVFYDMDLYINDEYVKTLFDGTLLDLITNPDKYYDKYIKNINISYKKYIELISDVKKDIGELVSNIIDTFNKIEDMEREYNSLERLYGKYFEDWIVRTYQYSTIKYDDNGNIIGIDLVLY